MYVLEIYWEIYWEICIAPLNSKNFKILKKQHMRQSKRHRQTAKTKQPKQEGKQG